jgi:stage V sporulation protein AA
MPLDIYLKLAKKAEIADRAQIYVHDVVDEVFAEEDIEKTIGDLKLMDINLTERGFIVVSVMDVIKTVKGAYPDHTVNNVGSYEVLVKYYPVKEKSNKLWAFIKTAFVSLVFFFGSATAIMSFHTDAQMHNIFVNIYKILFGHNTEKPFIIEIPYSFGLVAGIIVFFNHFAGKKITEDPTPIEVQVRQYESQTAQTLIDIIGSQKEGDAK